MPWFSVTAALILTLPAVSMAQWHPPITPGERIELSWRGRATNLVGTFVRATTDSLWVQYNQVDTAAVATGSLRRLRVHRGKERAITRYAVKGLMAGAAVGGAIGLVAGIADPDGAEFFGGVGGAAAFTAGLFAIPGILIGGLVGISVDVWEPVPLPGR